MKTLLVTVFLAAVAAAHGQAPLALLGNYNGTSIPVASSYSGAPISQPSNTQAIGYNATGVQWGQYTSGITATGTAGQTCLLTSFNNSSTATATIYLTGVNTIDKNTPLKITAAGTGATSAPTSATAGSGTATCSGTATILTALGAFVPIAVDANGNLSSGGGTTPTPFPGPVCRVTDYGAIGDITCTGTSATSACTNNHAAIQAAYDACYLNGGSVFYPTNPYAIGQTVYYTSPDVNPKGVSFFASPGASGAAGYYTTSLPVVVRGAPGKDVFRVVDAADAGYVAPHSSYTVQDLAILVDISTDSSASFIYRKPGRPFADGVTNNTAVLTSAAQAEFQPGDVGQAIKVGSTTTTILSWQSANQVTLATTVGAATGVSGYISVYGLPVTANIGNCGFAYDDRNGAYAGPHPSKVLFANMVINTITNNPTNSTCGFFFQGNQGPTITKWDNVFVGTQFGFNFVPASNVAPSTSIWTGIADNNVWDHTYIWSSYPFLVYSGEFQEIRAMQIAVEKYGPHIINAYGVVRGSTNWTINIPEMEPENGCSGGATSFRISGTNHLIQHLALGDCSTGGAIFQWDASTSKVESLRANRLSAWNINGDHNRFYYPTDANELNGVPINNTGVDNQIKVGSDHPTYVGLEPARTRFIPGGSTTFGDPGLSRGGIVFDRKADFIDKGASAYYFNAEDLWMWPQEMGGLGTGNAATLADTTSPTGSSLVIPHGTVQYVGEVNGTNLYVGSQVPAGKSRVYFSAKASTSVTFSVAVSAYYSAAWHDLCNGVFAGVTTSYVTYSCDADATGLGGDQFRLALATTGTVNTQVAWIGIRPYDSDPYGAYQSVANIQITTGTTPIAGNTCTTNTATTMTGLTTTSAIIPPTPTTSTAAVTGWGSVGGLSFTYYATAGVFNWSVCNTTATSITPGGSRVWNVGAR